MSKNDLAWHRTPAFSASKACCCRQGKPLAEGGKADVAKGFAGRLRRWCFEECLQFLLGNPDTLVGDAQTEEHKEVRDGDEALVDVESGTSLR
jgi:hypothetical protein